MRRSSDRAGTEPLAALVAVAVVCSALSLYAGLLPGSPSTSERAAAAERLLDRVYGRTAETGVVHPSRLDRALQWQGRWQGKWRTNVSVGSGTATWKRGPTPPAEAGSVATASRRVSVRGPLGRVRPGRLRVVVW
jgi:hypothetical protein